MCALFRISEYLLLLSICCMTREKEICLHSIYIYICIALFFFKPYVSILVMLVKLNLFPKYICGNGKIFKI